MRVLSTILCCVFMLVGAAPPQAGPSVRCLRVGNGAESGRLISIDGSKVTLTREGQLCTFPLDAFRQMDFQSQAARVQAPVFTAWTTNGSVLRMGGLRGSSGPGVSMAGAGWSVDELPLDYLRGFAAVGAADDESFQAALAAPPIAADRLAISRAGQQVVVSCTVDGLTDSAVTLMLQGARRKVALADIAWLVLGGSDPGAPAPEHLLCLADGSELRLPSLSFADGRLTAQDGQTRWTVESGALRSVILRSDAYAYLSDLVPTEVTTQPFLDVVWPPRMDTCANAEPMRLDGRTYRKGIGMHTRTVMSFGLGRRYRRFFATVGIDDSVGHLGKVVFRVLADGRKVFESDALAGGDDAVPLDVAIDGAETLTLVADFGSEIVASGNYADWADARVVR